MKKNIYKWDRAMAILNKLEEDFMNETKFVCPEKFYLIGFDGKVKECKFKARKYSNGLFFTGKNPKTQDVEKIENAVLNPVQLSTEKIFFDYSYEWGDGFKASTSISYKDIINNKKVFSSFEEAEKIALAIRQENQRIKDFKELHKKDTSYNYSANGYKFLGWQNGWNHVYFDEDGNQTTGDISKGEKPKKSFGYTKEQYPEYMNCIESKHIRIEVSHSRSGCENVVSCPICMIYYKYDSSD